MVHTKQVPLNVAALPLPDGSLLRFMGERSSLASIAAPRCSVPMFVLCIGVWCLFAET